MATLFDLAVNQNLTNRKLFWGKYENLNKAVPPTPTADMIHNYQLQKIENSQKMVLERARQERARFKEVEDLIYNKNDLGEYTAEEDREIQQSIQRIYDTIGEIRNTNKGRNLDGTFVDAKLQKQQMDILLSNLSNQLTILSTKFKTTGVYLKDLEELNSFIKAMSQFKTLKNRTFKSWYSRLSQLQGEFLEQIGISWGRKVIPSDIEILDTAKVYLSSKSYHSGQLISDLIYLDKNIIDIEETPISYSLDGKSYTVTLKDFIKIVNEQSGKTEQVVIDDTGYEILQKAIILQVQAKSGKTQLPWNVNASTQVAINEFTNETPENTSYLSVLQTLQLLKSLDEEQPNDQWVINDNVINYYQSMANYGLATVLYKVMHLDAEKGNQYLLTPDGIITFAERVYQLFKGKPQLYIKFSGSVSSNGKLRGLDHKYNVLIPWQQLI